MHRRAIPLVVFALAAITYADAPKLPSTEDALVAHLAEAKWVAPTVPGIPPGVMASPIAVDPSTGGSVGYAKFPPGFVFPTHWHSATEYTVLISGKASFTVAGKTHQLVPGSYLTVPPKTEHGVTCSQGADCVLLTRRGGPTDYHFVK